MSENTSLEKQALYATLMTRNKIALASSFYLEALSIEYAIIEDRLLSIMKHTDIPWQAKSGKDVPASIKLSRIKKALENGDVRLAKRIDGSLLTLLDNWLEVRNNLVHHTAHQLFNNLRVEQCAKEGAEIVRQLSNACRRIQRAAEKAQ